MSVKIQERLATKAEWTAENPTLLEGEWGLETDTQRRKQGRYFTGTINGTVYSNELVLWDDLGYEDGIVYVDSAATGLGFTQMDIDALLEVEAATLPNFTIPAQWCRMVGNSTDLVYSANYQGIPIAQALLPPYIAGTHGEKRVVCLANGATACIVLPVTEEGQDALIGLDHQIEIDTSNTSCFLHCSNWYNSSVGNGDWLNLYERQHFIFEYYFDENAGIRSNRRWASIGRSALLLRAGGSGGGYDGEWGNDVVRDKAGNYQRYTLSGFQYEYLLNIGKELHTIPVDAVTGYIHIVNDGTRCFYMASGISIPRVVVQSGFPIGTELKFIVDIPNTFDFDTVENLYHGNHSNNKFALELQYEADPNYDFYIRVRSGEFIIRLTPSHEWMPLSTYPHITWDYYND